MALTISQQKIAERLKILYDHAIGITTRIYNIKKACGDAQSKPSFLSEKTLEGALKVIVKKFPAIDIRSGGASMQHVHQIRTEILKSLQLYYYTFVDLLDLRDNINELLTTVDACQVQFDVSINTDLTCNYLDLMTSYVSLMILLARVDDRKAVLGLYNAAYEMQHGNAEPSFPRLGQLIMDYEIPVRKLSEEFIPHHRPLYSALASLKPIYIRRNLSASELRKADFLSLSSTPSQLLYPVQTDTIPCEYLSLERMDRWIILGVMVCHSAVGKPGVGELFTEALHSSLVTQVYRDEVIATHSYIQTFFDTVKGYSKKVTDVKEAYNVALQQACLRHRERRKFLRSALRELVLIMSDQPGLLGPKVLFIWSALSFARDEVHWLIRHTEHWPLQSSKSSKLPDDLVDRQIPELLFYMEELRWLVERYTQVIQRYYIQYLSGFDALALNELIQTMNSCPEEESIILSAMCNAVSNLSSEELSAIGVEDGNRYDFRGLRLDWCRLQAYASCSRSNLVLMEHRKLSYQINTLVFHTKMVDFLDQMLVETADLSIFCFYTSLLENWFNMCIELPSQARYLPAFPLVCAHFMNSCHVLCPEERIHVGERGLTWCNLFLDKVANEIKNVVTSCAEQHCLMADKLVPKNCARLLAETLEAQQKRAKKTAKGAGGDKGSQVNLPAVVALPGVESYRRSREDITTLDKLHMALTELCTAVGYRNTIVVWDHTFAPREYLTQHLESRFNKTVKAMVMFDSERQIIAKPSELLSSIRAFMSVLQTVENFVAIDIARIFNNVLLQQTQSLDSNGEDTITTLYTKWYLEVLLRRVSCCHILYSPPQMSFILQEGFEERVHFDPKEYTDSNELISLSELMGPYGVKFLCERLTWHVASQITELKKLVVAHKDTLKEMRMNYDKPERMNQLSKDLNHATVGQGSSKGGDTMDSFLQRLTIIGEILSFRDLALSALRQVLQDRSCFLLECVTDLQDRLPLNNPDILSVYEMCSSAGQKTPVDATLVNAIKAQRPEEKSGPTVLTPDEDHQISCLLMVFISACLPRLAFQSNSFYKASIDAHVNNVHCVPKAINEIASALFSYHGRGDIQDRMREFLALASGNLLRLGQREIDRNSQPNTESTYILLDKLVDESPWLGRDLLESCFPYVLLRSAYHYAYKQESFQAMS